MGIFKLKLLTVLFASGPLAASEAQAFGGFGFHRGWGGCGCC
ncbi:MAG: hypothetical protein WBZ36_01140 [Candidatus Nitrosopolaris sp.]